jgi:thiamine biosynthesis lipoprotein
VVCLGRIYVEGGFDPSGLVKGWAADKCANILVAVGAEHVQVNAAGDVALRGGWFDSTVEEVKPWSIGVVNPDNRLEVVKIYEITDGAMATAVIVGGTDSAKWFGQPELQGYQVFGVNRHEDSAWEI